MRSSNQAKHLAHGHTGIPLDQMLVSATHTHTAPTAGRVFQSEPDPAYLEFLAVRIADAIRRAAHNLAPAKIGWGIGPRTDAGLQPPLEDEGRRGAGRSVRPARPRADESAAGQPRPDRAGRADRSGDRRAVGATRRRSAAGRAGQLLAALRRRRAAAGDVSADYYGAFADRVQQLLGADRLDPPFVGIMSNGTSGNINNINFREQAESQPPYAQIRNVADAGGARSGPRGRADRVSRLGAAGDARGAAATGPPCRRPRTKWPGRSSSCRKAKGAVLTRRGGDLRPRDGAARRVSARTSRRSCRRCGSATWASRASPCETFVETGLAIKAASPLKPTFTIELANDYRGYLPTAEHHKLGGYETWRARQQLSGSRRRSQDSRQDAGAVGRGGQDVKRLVARLPEQLREPGPLRIASQLWVFAGYLFDGGQGIGRQAERRFSRPSLHKRKTARRAGPTLGGDFLPFDERGLLFLGVTREQQFGQLLLQFAIAWKGLGQTGSRRSSMRLLIAQQR